MKEDAETWATLKMRHGRGEVVVDVSAAGAEVNISSLVLWVECPFALVV